jgi:hypothetical protein
MTLAIQKSYISQRTEEYLLSSCTPEVISKALQEKLYILLGTSCSGKSTFCNELSKRLPHVVSLEYDDRLRDITLLFFYKLAPNSFTRVFNALGKSLLHYLDINFKTDFFAKKRCCQLSHLGPHLAVLTSLFKKHAPYLRERTYSSLLEDSKRLTCLGRRVIIHVVGRRGFSKFGPFKPKIVLFHCPLDDVIRRAINRNRRARLEDTPLDYRKIDIVATQYNALFNKNNRFVRPGLREDIKRSTNLKPIFVDASLPTEDSVTNFIKDMTP